MKVSHEVPLNYLEFSKKFNDYDYALVHLFVDHPDYLEFFKRSIAQGREVILDNSAYEITTNPELLEKYPAGYFPEDQYIKYIQELKPTYYVMPDVKDDCDGTITVVSEWLTAHPDLKSKSIGVVHGNSFEEMQKCYDFLADRCDKIAFSFESWWFTHASSHNIHVRDIRHYMISKLKIRTDKPHHLLGCILPDEFKLWKDTVWIESIDTSAPITNAIEHTMLQSVMTSKPKTTIHGSFELEFDIDTAARMKANAKLFRMFYLKKYC